MQISTNIVGKSNCSSNGLNNICASKRFSAYQKTLSNPKFGRQFVFMCSSPSSKSGLASPPPFEILQILSLTLLEKPELFCLFHDHLTRNTPQDISNQLNL